MPLHAPNAQTRDDNALALVLFPRIDTINFVSPRLVHEPRRWIHPIDSFAVGYRAYYFFDSPQREQSALSSLRLKSRRDEILCTHENKIPFPYFL